MSTSYDAIAEVYDADMGASMTLPDTACYLRHAAAADGPVLELGCGTGRVLAALREAGIDAIGVDRSVPMLRLAAHRLDDARPLLCMDLRHLGLRAEFSLALLPYSLATYLLDDADWVQLACGLRHALRRGAKIVVDAFVPQPGVADGLWRRDYARRLDGRWLVRHKAVHAEPGGLNRIVRRYRCSGRFDGRTCITDERIRPFQPAQLVECVERFLGPVQAMEYDYGTCVNPLHARHCTVIARLAD